MLLNQNESAVIAVDLQSKFLAPILDRERVMNRGLLLTNAAKVLNIPQVATLQYSSRMGGLDAQLADCYQSHQIYDKMSFSICGNSTCLSDIKKLGKKQIVLWGIETPICVCQSALDLLTDFEVYVAVDAVGARNQMDHVIALDRMKTSGITLTCVDSIIYEWLRSAEHIMFKNILQLVKNSG